MESGGGVGAPVAGAVVLAEADGFDAGVGVGRVDAEEQEAFVVLEEDVVAGAVLLDELRLGEGRLGFGAERDGVEVGDGADQAAEAGLGLGEGRGAEVGGDAGAQGGRLADVDDAAAAVAHEVDAGAVGEGREFVVDEFGEGGGEGHGSQKSKVKGRKSKVEGREHGAVGEAAGGKTLMDG